MKDSVMYLCPRCDGVYFEIDKATWDKDRKGWNEKSRKAKRDHLCPWVRRKKEREARRK